MAYIINGNELAEQIKTDIKEKIKQHCILHPRPCFAIVKIGSSPASNTYVSAKRKAAEEVGISCIIKSFPDTITQQNLLIEIAELNNNLNVHGIIVQLPLPTHFNTQTVIQAIHPQKDIDGISSENIGKLIAGIPYMIPCTAKAVLYALQAIGVPLTGVHAAVIGRSLIAGKPIASLLTNKDATVTLCHRKTESLKEITKSADLLIVAAGSPACVTGDMVKQNSIVIDVGINRIPDNTAPKGYRLTGDIVFEEAVERATYITPVPGGIGPLTVVAVLENTFQAACALQGRTPLSINFPKNSCIS